MLTWGKSRSLELFSMFSEKTKKFHENGPVPGIAHKRVALLAVFSLLLPLNYPTSTNKQSDCFASVYQSWERWNKWYPWLQLLLDASSFWIHPQALIKTIFKCKYHLSPVVNFSFQCQRFSLRRQILHLLFFIKGIWAGLYLKPPRFWWMLLISPIV